ncbi:putative N6-adenine-specific DNA methylase [Litorimonas taeanensis]|uniref:Putative N6-adenine-specific DNA methylase n=2 Tax=Litorimonas taeanensis TaxID=568099 RepID=A0A420WF47_9PROT|nr:class I SAM-dependent RNA methyltransferase [Litorimonas taeanensis]RKQ69607.1 putative N6-adenine-specific DNA methylase [Litorimonas taeanensis]
MPSSENMPQSDTFEIFLGTAPGLEPYLLSEVKAAGFNAPKAIGGGVLIQGSWTDVWRANLSLRGASKVLARIGEFRAFHLAQLDKRARRFPWNEILMPGHMVKVEVVTNRKSKIYHAGAAIERIERAIAEEFGAEIASSMEEAEILIKTRIDDNNVRFSVDTSGVGLHKRGYKQAMGKAPLRETMAALLLRGCGYTGNEPVLDPMCGSGTILIEAAEIAQNKLAGRNRAFAFEKLATYDAQAVQALRQAWKSQDSPYRFYGSDRNVKVIGFAQENAQRAGVDTLCHFTPTPLIKLKRPEGPAGLVMVNPPYGARIGKKKDLFALYRSFGDVMRREFTGWRVGMVTSDNGLAQATELPWRPTDAPIAHGGLRVTLFQTDILE